MERFDNKVLVVAFDADASGQRGAEYLGELLAEAGAGRRVRRLAVPDEVSEDAKERTLVTGAGRWRPGGVSWAEEG